MVLTNAEIQTMTDKELHGINLFIRAKGYTVYSIEWVDDGYRRIVLTAKERDSGTCPALRGGTNDKSRKISV